MALEPLVSDCPAIVYIDFKSPYAYLAVEPTRELENELGVKFDWRPFVLDIPSYLGTARLNKKGGVATQNRSSTQWSGIKYAYYDCRRYANLRKLTIRGTEKIWDTNLAATAMLWTKKYGNEVQQKFIDLVLEPFWKRDLDLENAMVVGEILDQVGANGSRFIEWAHAEGAGINTQLQAAAFSAGVFGVPTYVVGTELYFGREHLPRIRWQLLGQHGINPDIANTLPSNSIAQAQTPSQVTIGVDDSLDSLLALPQIIELFSGFSGSIDWVMVEAKRTVTPTTASVSSRGALHKQLRKSNSLRNIERYNSTGSAPGDYMKAMDEILELNQIRLQEDGPEQVVRPAMPGIVILLDEELFIGRQHLPLIASRIGPV